MTNFLQNSDNINFNVYSVFPLVFAIHFLPGVTGLHQVYLYSFG